MYMAKYYDAFRKWLGQRIGFATEYLNSHTGSITPFRWLGNVLGSAVGKYSGTQLTAAEREANAFTAQQNQEAMAFEERMADKQMAFQADQAATQWQRGVTDMQAAGLNPALAYGQGGASAMSGSSGAGHAGSSVTPGVGSLSDLIALATLKPTIENMQAQARETRSRARIQEIDAETRGEINNATVREISERISNLAENTRLTKYQRDVILPLEVTIRKIEKDKIDYETTSAFVNAVYDGWRYDFYNKNHYWPGDNAQKFFFQVIQGYINGEGAPFRLSNGDRVQFPMN